MPLQEYLKKLKFTRTHEPSDSQKRDPAGKKLVFVVHKHAASRLHYDLRLEAEGVLKSWAVPVPKGPSLNPRDKRLAIMVGGRRVDETADLPRTSFR